MSLNKNILKGIAKTVGGLVIVYLAIYYANWPKSEYWHVGEQQRPGEEDHEYAGRLLRQRAERLCMEKSGWTRETYKTCQSNWDSGDYLGKVELCVNPIGDEYNKFIALAPGDEGYNSYRRADVQRLSRSLSRSLGIVGRSAVTQSADDSPVFVGGPASIDAGKRLDICKGSSDAQCEEILKVYRERGSQAAEQLRVKYWEEYRASNPPPADDTPIPEAQPEQSEDALMFQAAANCRSDDDLKKPECITALNAYRMKAAQRILAEREAYGPAPAPTGRGSSSHFPPPQPPPRDQVYYLHDGTRVQESPGGMRQISPPNKSALPSRGR